MNINWMQKGISGMTALALALTLTACGAQEERAPEGDAASLGTILLSVNPEIEMAYDQQGQVVRLTGVNEDGRKVVRQFPEADYLGKPCDTVIDLLVAQIHQDGYLEHTVDGHPKNIILKLEEGSEEPAEGFVEQLAQGAQQVSAGAGSDLSAIPVKPADLDRQGRIGLEKAREIVLKQLGLTDAVFAESAYDLDDGVYEFELVSGEYQYEYEVDAMTGKVRSADLEHNDDWKSIREDSGQIGLSKAREMVLKALGAAETDLTEAEYNVRRNVYEIEVTVGDYEYSCDVDALSGTITRTEREYSDAWEAVHGEDDREDAADPEDVDEPDEDDIDDPEDPDDDVDDPDDDRDDVEDPDDDDEDDPDDDDADDDND